MFVFYDGFGYIETFEYDFDSEERLHLKKHTLRKHRGVFFTGYDTGDDLKLFHFSTIDSLGFVTDHNPRGVIDKWTQNSIFIITDKEGNPTPFSINPVECIYRQDNGNALRLLSTGESRELFTTPPPINTPQLEYLNVNHPMYSVELAAAIETWQSVLESNPPRPKMGSRKSLIERHLAQNYSTLNKSQHNRITGILNPDKGGGAPKIE